MEPTLEATVGAKQAEVPKATKDAMAPKLMIFDSNKKPMQGAAAGTVKIQQKSELIPLPGKALPALAECKNGDKDCKRIPTFTKAIEKDLSLVQKQHLSTKPVMSKPLPESGIKTREPS